MKVMLIALNASYMHTSLALRQLLPTLEGLDVVPYEGHINLPHRRVLDDIIRANVDVAAFSCYIWNISQIMRLVRSLKRARPEIKIILGGPEVGHRAQMVLDAHPEVDFVIEGEGERSLRSLLIAIERGDCADPIQSDIALPPDLWTDAYAQGIAGIERRLIYIETSRGCPYNCQFCLSSAEAGVRALDANESVRRLTALAEGGAKIIKLVDRTFNFDRKRANAIWSALIDHAEANGIADCVYHFEIGAHLLDDSAMAILRRAPMGLFQFEVGIQSSNSSVLSVVKRSAQFDAVARGARAIAALGTIHLHVDLIAGMPGDDMRKFAQSFDDAYALGAEQLQLGFLKLLHGSGLKCDAERLGIEYEPDAPYEVLRTRELSADDLCELKDVETVVDWYHNSGLYACSMRNLTGHGSPFALFHEIAKSFRVQGIFDVERGERARATALLDHFAGDELLCALMRHDLLTAHRRRDLPDALQFQETPDQRAILRERFHPVRGQSLYDYGYDVEAFSRDGSIVKRPTRIIYDPAHH